MAQRRVRWGVLSTASIGRWAVNPAIQSSRNGELVAVASRDADRARSFAREHGIPWWHGSYQELLDDSGIDAVYIPLPNSLHAEWAVRAAEARKHILCEKPLAVTAAEAAAMGRAAERHGVLLMEAFMYRFHPRTEQVLAMVRAGALGELRAIRSVFTFRLTRPNNIRLSTQLGGGALMDVGCYCVNVSRTLAGAEPLEAQAWAAWGPTGVDLQLAGMLRFPGDVMAHFDCALTLERREHYEAAGTDASVQVPAAFLPGKDAVAFTESRGREEATTHQVAGADEYQRMVEHFADCVLTGQPVRYPVSEAVANLRAIEALYRSARTAAPVRLAGGTS